MRGFWVGVLTVLVAPVLAGCGPAVSQEELGEVVFEVPDLPGTEEPYELPEIKPVEGQEYEPPASELSPLPPMHEE